MCVWQDVLLCTDFHYTGNELFVKNDTIFTMDAALSDKPQPSASEAEVSFFPCAYCPMKFSNVQECYNHVRLHVEGKISNTADAGGQDMMGQQSGTTNSLNGNMTPKPKWKRPPRKNAERNFSCEICDKKFATQRYLRQYHMLTHLDCKKCSQSFVSLEEASDHRKMHENEKKKKSCTVKFDPHMKYVRECELDIKNDLNKKASASSEEMQNTSNPQKRDEKTHDKLYACNICNKTFSDLKYLMKRHLLSHFVPCKLCSKTFLNLDEVLEHQKIHPDNNIAAKSKSHVCKTYSKMSKLKMHSCSPAGKKDDSFKM